MERFTQSRVASAPARRQGFARSVRRLEPPLTAARAPAQRAISSCLTQLLRSFNHCSNTKFLIVPPEVVAITVAPHAWGFSFNVGGRSAERMARLLHSLRN